MTKDESPDKNFDSEAFYAAIAATVVARDVTWKEVSQQTAVSTTTLTRMSQGRKPDAASLAALSAWAGINPADYVRLEIGSRAYAPEPLAQITTLLRSDRRLTPDAAKALEVMIRTAYGQLRDASSEESNSEGTSRRGGRRGR